MCWSDRSHALSFGFQTYHSLSDPGQAAAPSRDFSILLNYTLKCFPLLFIRKRNIFLPTGTVFTLASNTRRQWHNLKVDTAISSLSGMGQNIPHTQCPPRCQGEERLHPLSYAANVNLKPRGGKLQDAVITTRPIEENK